MTNSVFKPISENRLELFGFSILWIVFFHFDFFPLELIKYQTDIGKGLFLTYKNIKQMGYFGVDIFFFLSGLGLMTSWLNESNIYKFYKKRIYRIVPVYYIVLLVELLLVSRFAFESHYWRDISLKQAALLFSGLDFFITKSLVIWFISSILICYILFPFFARVFLLQKRKGLIIICSITCIILCSVFISIFMKGFSYLLIFTTRIPSFLIGIYIGYAIYYKIEPVKYIKDVKLNLLYLIIGFGILVAIYTNIPTKLKWQYGLWWYPCIFLSFPSAYCLSILLNFLKRNYLFRKLILVISLIGACSLEIFLINEFIIRQGRHLAFFDTTKLYLLLYIFVSGAMLKLLDYASKRLVSPLLTRLVR